MAPPLVWMFRIFSLCSKWVGPGHSVAAIFMCEIQTLESVWTHFSGYFPSVHVWKQKLQPQNLTDVLRGKQRKKTKCPNVSHKQYRSLWTRVLRQLGSAWQPRIWPEHKYLMKSVKTYMRTDETREKKKERERRGDTKLGMITEEEEGRVHVNHLSVFDCLSLTTMR